MMKPLTAFWITGLWTALALCCFANEKVADSRAGDEPIVAAGLLLDLDADKGVESAESRVVKWTNQAAGKAKEVIATRDTGRPALRKSVEALRGHSALVFERQELINGEEDVFDPLTTGDGYTWLTVLAPHRQNPGLKDVNSFFGNLRNGGNYEGFWAGFNDDNTLWIGSRNSTSFGRWNADNPKVLGPKLEENRFYIVGGRMDAGTGEVKVELFVNEARAVAALPFPVNPKANASKMAIGQERDATNHPGHESFAGEMARMLIWGRPLADGELESAMAELAATYGIARKLVWIGGGADDKWSTAANWNPARVPGAGDTVVLDGTSATNSRWDGERHIGALTVTPEYKGQFTFAGHGSVEGDVILSGRIHSARDMHQWLWMRGSRVDLSAVTEWTQMHRYSGGIDLGGRDAALVQKFTAPAVRIGDLRIYEKGTGVFAGVVIAAMVEAGSEKTVDFKVLHGRVCLWKEG